MATIIGYWDCAYCGSKKLLGTLQDCPNCGRKRPRSTKFYMSGEDVDIKDITSEATVREFSRRKADWVCPYCDGLNSSLEELCTSCGAGKTDHTYFDEHRPEPNTEAKSIKQLAVDLHMNEITPELPIDEELEPKYVEYIEADLQATEIIHKTFSREQAKPRIPIKQILTYSLIGLLLIASLVGIVYLCIPKQVSLEVQAIEWYYNQTVEECQTFVEEGWSLPYNARKLTSERRWYGTEQVLDYYDTETYTVREITGYERVQDGYTYEDNGNGTFDKQPKYKNEPVYEYVTKTRQVPVYKDEDVYKTWYKYEIDRWITVRHVDSAGTTHDTYWAEVALAEKERSVRGAQTYIIRARLVDNEDQSLKEFHMSEAEWRQVNPGDIIECDVYITGNIKLKE